MQYLPSAIQSADLDTAESAYFGGEFAVYVTPVPAVKIGEIDLDGSSIGGIWVPNPAAAIKTGGADLAIVPITTLLSSVKPVFTLAGVDNSGSPVAMNGSAAFAAPARAANQAYNFARGFALDLVPAVAGKKFTSITGLASQTFAVTAVAIAAAGTGYSANDVLDITGGTHTTAAQIKILTVSGGVPQTIAIQTPGVYSVQPTNPVSTTGGGGTGATFTLTFSPLAPIAGGTANNKLAVYQLPEAADWSLIPASTEIDFNTKSRMAKGIDAGMEADFWVKRGKTQPGELSIGSKFQSFAEGYARFDGLKCTVMLVGIKDGQVTGDRLVFTQYVGNIKPKLPEGDGESTIAATGKFVDHLFFVAP